MNASSVASIVRCRWRRHGSPAMGYVMTAPYRPDGSRPNCQRGSPRAASPGWKKKKCFCRGVASWDNSGMGAVSSAIHKNKTRGIVRCSACCSTKPTLPHVNEEEISAFLHSNYSDTRRVRTDDQPITNQLLYEQSRTENYSKEGAILSSAKAPFYTAILYRAFRARNGYLGPPSDARQPSVEQTSARNRISLGWRAPEIIPPRRHQAHFRRLGGGIRPRRGRALVRG